MKKLLIGFLASLPFMANAQFTPGQVLTAAELNNQFALYAPLAGATFTGPVTIPTLTVGTAIVLPNGSIALTKLATQAANTVVANVTAGTASPTAFAMPSCSTSGSALTYTTNTGFTCNTAVNAAQLGGATFATPGPIGSTTPSTGAFTTLSATSTVSGAGFTSLFASPPPIGSTAANTGAFTNLTTNGTITTTFPGGGGSSSNFVNVSSSAGGPSIAFENTTFGADSKWWDILEGAGALYFRAVNDANNASTFYMTVNRGSGYTVSNVAFGVPISPSSTLGILGTTTNDNVNAGSIGEFVSSQGVGVSLSNGVSANITSISLTAGDWDIRGNIEYIPAGTTVLTQCLSGTNTTSATLPAAPARALGNYTSAASLGQSQTVPITRLSLASTTTVYLVGFAGFTTSTLTATGFISARRIR